MIWDWSFAARTLPELLWAFVRYTLLITVLDRYSARSSASSLPLFAGCGCRCWRH